MCFHIMFLKFLMTENFFAITFFFFYDGKLFNYTFSFAVRSLCFRRRLLAYPLSLLCIRPIRTDNPNLRNTVNDAYDLTQIKNCF